MPFVAFVGLKHVLLPCFMHNPVSNLYFIYKAIFLI